MAYIAQTMQAPVSAITVRLKHDFLSMLQQLQYSQHALSGDYPMDTWTSTWRPQYRNWRDVPFVPPTVGRPDSSVPRVISPAPSVSRRGHTGTASVQAKVSKHVSGAAPKRRQPRPVVG